MNDPIDVSPKPVVEPAYLGDGCYVRFDGYQLWLFTSDGQHITNEIALERGVYNELIAYAKRLSF